MAPVMPTSPEGGGLGATFGFQFVSDGTKPRLIAMTLPSANFAGVNTQTPKPETSGRKAVAEA